MVCCALSFWTFTCGWWGGRDFIQKLLRRGTTIDAISQGIKLTFFSGSHLAPKYFKVVANSKKLVVIMTPTQPILTLSLCQRVKLPIDMSCCQNIRSSYKEDTTMGHIQHERLPKSKMASSDNDRFFDLRSKLCMCCILETGLTRNLAADLSLQIFNNH